ncbi:MAG: ATP F0F1 synthase subunit B [Proteobacteria bacterium]|nr:ATP F0F1 synthase subunit B [Pseudomonadota bacterium]
MTFAAEFWVAVAFVLFVGVLGYFRTHRLVLDGLDKRSQRIRDELDDARRLKDEAGALLAQYERQRVEADKEAQGIIVGARAEAERMTRETQAKVEDFIARRTKMAEGKIAIAEQQAAAEVKAAAADAAVAAAARILAASVKDKTADDLIARGIADLRAKLN